jgi:hypothetical protein
MKEGMESALIGCIVHLVKEIEVGLKLGGNEMTVETMREGTYMESWPPHIGRVTAYLEFVELWTCDLL